MDKLWVKSHGPIMATEADVRRCQMINSLLVRPIGILPAVPGDQIRPFAIGLFEEIRALLKPDLSVIALRRAIAGHVHSKRYYFASAQPDAMRYDIDGQPLEPVSEADSLVAQQRFTQHKGQAPENIPQPEPPPEIQPSKNDQIRAALLGRTKRSAVTG